MVLSAVVNSAYARSWLAASTVIASAAAAGQAGVMPSSMPATRAALTGSAAEFATMTKRTSVQFSPRACRPSTVPTRFPARASSAPTQAVSHASGAAPTVMSGTSFGPAAHRASPRLPPCTTIQPSTCWVANRRAQSSTRLASSPGSQRIRDAPVAVNCDTTDSVTSRLKGSVPAGPINPIRRPTALSAGTVRNGTTVPVGTAVAVATDDADARRNRTSRW